MNQIVITKTDQAVSNLAELAHQINAEHDLVAVRDGVAFDRCLVEPDTRKDSEMLEGGLFAT